MGFGFYKDFRAYLYKAKPHTLSVKRLKEKIKFISSRSNGWSFERRLIQLRYLFRAWFNYFKVGAIKTISKEIDKYTRFRLRMCIWKQWKKISAKENALKKLGIPKHKA